MSRSAELKSINCTSCGAGLNVLGGGRVVRHACSYCGAVLDAQENYRVLKKYANQERPASPLSIGMSGEINGVAFTIIGTLGVMEKYRGQTWRWTEHQLYSETHGYAWISVEDEHLIFTRKIRKVPTPNWITPQRVETSEKRPFAVLDRKHYKYYETSTSEITYIEGEFNWQVDMGDRSTTVSLLSDASMLGFTENAYEREIEHSVYLPHADTLASFGADPAPKPGGAHPLLPYEPHPEEGFAGVGLLVSAITAAFLSLMFLFESGDRLLGPVNVPVSGLPTELTFEVESTERLSHIRIYSDVSNSWAWFDVAVTGPEDEPLFEAGRAVEYYFGREDGESWSEGSRTSTLMFRPQTTGPHTVSIEMPEAGTWGRDGAPNRELEVLVTSGRGTPRWTLALAILFGLGAAIIFGRRRLHQLSRWKGSDWTDED